MNNRGLVAAAFCAAVGSGIAGAGEIKLVAKAIIPAKSTDLSGLTDMLAGGVEHNRLGALGSGIDFSGRNDRYVMLPDRGPADGATEYRCRFHVVEVVAGAGDSASIALAKTVLLSDEQGRPLVGSSAAFDTADPAGTTRFDPEAIRIARDGSVYISDEYGPQVCVFSPEGRLLRRFEVPARYGVAHPDAIPGNELPPANTTGREPNGGFEGLALTPDGFTLVTMTQHALLQDGTIHTKDDGTKEVRGANLRMLMLSVEGDPPREFVYQMASDSMGVNEILAVSPTHFLVLERDGKGGDKAAHKMLFLVNTEGATDVSGIASLAERELPAGVRPVTKTRFLDLLDPRFGLKGDDFPKKVEGLSFGPNLGDGQGTLIVTTDNDFDDEQPTHVWVFSFDRADLPAARKTNAAPAGR